MRIVFICIMILSLRLLHFDCNDEPRCGFNIPVSDNQYVLLLFKDEAFVVPKDLAGKMVLIEGTATSEQLSVELQKKAAKAEGLSQKEIDAITTPVTEYYYEATGLVIK